MYIDAEMSLAHVDTYCPLQDKDKDKDKDKGKGKYMGLSLLCGKIYRTVKYQYFGWFEEPIIKIEVLEYV